MEGRVRLKADRLNLRAQFLELPRSADKRLRRVGREERMNRSLLSDDTYPRTATPTAAMSAGWREPDHTERSSKTVHRKLG